MLWQATFFTGPQAAIIVLFGLALGLGASAMSVGRHLGRV
jgi:hypothetical protein